MKLIIMTKPTFFVEEDKILSALFDEGLDNLHLCKPGAAPVYSERLLTLLGEDCYNKITVHGNFYLKEEYRLKGIHIDDALTPPPQGYKGHMSRTCRSTEVLKEAKRKADYVFLGNLYDSLTDGDAKADLTPRQMEEAARNGLIDKKVYAMGGMTLETIRAARDLGFGGVVVCGDLWNRFDIHNQLDYKELISHFERLRKATN